MRSKADGRRVAGTALAVGVAGCIAVAAMAWPGAHPAALAVAFVDVGQGDGTAWKLPDGSIAVYDCGPPGSAPGASPVVRELHALGLPRGGSVALLVASHGHADHVGACADVVREFRVAHTYDPGYRGPDAPPGYRAFEAALAARGGVLHALARPTGPADPHAFRAGDALALPPAAEAAGVRAEVLWPPASELPGWSRIADASIVVRLSYGATSFCFQGDIAAQQERAVEARLAGRGCTVLLVGHHGSRYASSAPWLRAAHPRIGVVSFGANPFGHPASEALCRVQRAGAAVYATQRDGTVVVSSDGREVRVLGGARPEQQDYCAPGATYAGGR
jgi:beta-lactamase superfamily II metal-dependent hydrolase